MSQGRTYNRGGKVSVDNWVPKRRPASYYQELEAAKSADITIKADPNVVVKTNGEELPDKFRHFRDHFGQKLRQNAEKCGFTELRKVQRAALPYIDAGYTVCMTTTARSGKSIAYMLPMVQKVHDDLKNTQRQWYCPRAVIVCYCMEHTKFIFEQLCALAAGMGINTVLFNGQKDDESMEARKTADILVTTLRSVEKNLMNKKLSFSLLKYFVMEGTEGHLVPGAYDKSILNNVFTKFDEVASNAQMVLVSGDITALEFPFWKERVAKMEKSKSKYVVLSNEQKISPSNHVLIRSRETDIPQTVVEAIKSYENGQILVVVQSSNNDYEAKSQQIQQHLEKNGIISNIYDSSLAMRTKDIQFDDFVSGKVPVLIMKYIYVTRLIRCPNVKQVIHVSVPTHIEEAYLASYHYSSSIVAFALRARSVLIFEVDDDRDVHHHRMTKIVDAILDCTMSVDWPKNYVPMWVKKYYGNDGLTKWDPSDKEGVNDLADLWPVDSQVDHPEGPNQNQNNQIEYYDPVPPENMPYIDNDRQGPSGQKPSLSGPQQHAQQEYYDYCPNCLSHQGNRQNDWNGQQTYQQPQQQHQQRQYRNNWEGPSYQVQHNQRHHHDNWNEPSYQNNQQQYNGHGHDQPSGNYNEPTEPMVYTNQNSGNWQNYQRQHGHDINQQQNSGYCDYYDGGRPPSHLGDGMNQMSQNRNIYGQQQEFNQGGNFDYGIDDGLQRMQINEENHPVENFHGHQGNQSNQQVNYEPQQYNQERRRSYSHSQDVRAYQENVPRGAATNPNIIPGNRFAHRRSESGQGNRQGSPRYQQESPQQPRNSNPNIVPGNRFAHRRSQGNNNAGNNGNR